MTQWQRMIVLQPAPIRLDGGTMFGRAPRSYWEKLIPPDALGRIPIATRSLFLEADDRRLLIDAGMGKGRRGSFQKHFDAPLEGPDVRDELQKHGVSPESITDVFMTHLHFDHAGGLIQRPESSGVVPSFPNALVWIHRDHWRRAHQPTRFERASFVAEDFGWLAGDSRLRLLDDPPSAEADHEVEEAGPGVEYLRCDGHTCAMCLPLFQCCGSTYLFAADLIPTRHHLRLPFIMAFDRCAETTLREKESILPMAKENGWRLLLQHDPDGWEAPVD